MNEWFPTPTDDDIRYRHEDNIDVRTVEYGGIEGRVAFARHWVGVYAPWASHTGYRTLMTGMDIAGRLEDPAFQARIEHELVALYEENAALPWLVGAEHEEWRLLEYSGHQPYQDPRPGWIIRVPQWGHALILDALEAHGFEEIDDLNNLWCYPCEKSAWTESEIRAALEPLLMPGSRLAHPEALAERLRSTLAPLAPEAQQEQLGLFDMEP